MHKYRTAWLLFLRHKHSIEQVIQCRKLLCVVLNSRVVGPREHLVVLYDALSNWWATNCISLLEEDDPTGHSGSWCGLLNYLTNCDAVVLVLVLLVPVGAALLHTKHSDNWAEHDNQMNLVVPHHLPEVCERWTGSNRLRLVETVCSQGQLLVILFKLKRCISIILLRLGRLLLFSLIVVVESGGAGLKPG